MTQFEGIKYRLCTQWLDWMLLEHFNKPINYLEIGAFYGGNVLSVEETYAKHPESRIYVIDPWVYYKEYNEYEEMDMDKVYNAFLHKTDHIKDKLVIKRGFSDSELPKLPQDFFDIIYIDGNHEAEYVYADAILSWSKLKVGGYIIFDDYDERWMGVIHGVEAFITYKGSKIEVITRGCKNQTIIKKMKS
jgi:hypothetical protein